MQSELSTGAISAPNGAFNFDPAKVTFILSSRGCPLTAEVVRQTRLTLGGARLAAEQEGRLVSAVSQLVSRLKQTPAREREALIAKAFNDLLKERQAEIELTEANLDFRGKGAKIFPFLERPVRLIEQGLSLLKEQYQVLRQKGAAGYCSEMLGCALAWLDRHKGKAVFLLPFVLPAYAFMAQQDLGLSFSAAAKLSVSLLVLDKILDIGIENSKKVLPAWLITLAVAAATNAPELCQSWLSALKGDSLSTAAATPLGSNPWNVALAGCALAAAVCCMGRFKAAAAGNEQAGQAQRKVDWVEIGRQLGLASGLAASALAFKLFVNEPGMLGGAWFLGNAAIVAGYLYFNTFSRDARIYSAAKDLTPQQVAAIAEQIDSMPDSTRVAFTGIAAALAELSSNAPAAIEKVKSRAAEIQKVINRDPGAHHALKQALAPASAARRALVGALKDIAGELSKNGFDRHLAEQVQKDGAALSAMISFLESCGVKGLGKVKGDPRTWAKLTACVVVLGACSVGLDSGVDDMSSFLDWNKGKAAFVFMSLFSSFPELFVSAKFFKEGRDRAGAKNMADSNALNIAIAQGAMVLCAIRTFLRGS